MSRTEDFHAGTVGTTLDGLRKLAKSPRPAKKPAAKAKAPATKKNPPRTAQPWGM